MTARYIKSISFLIKEKRYRVFSTKYGKFKVPSIKSVNGRSKSATKMISSIEVIQDPTIRSGDPSLTLSTGEKIRVFQGGDTSYMLTEAASLIDLHDKYFEEKNKKSLEKIKKTIPVKKVKETDYSIFEDLNGW